MKLTVMKQLRLFLSMLLLINLAVSTTIVPERLKQGDTIGLISSASQVLDKNEIFLAKSRLESLGFKVIFGTHIFAGYASSTNSVLFSESNPGINPIYRDVHINLAGSDQDRALDVMQMFKNHKVKAIIELRGGYGSSRILDLLNYCVIKKNPKLIIGYSDITNLILAINTKTGLVTYHGPVAWESWSYFTTEYFEKVTMHKNKGLIFNEYHPVADESGNVANPRFTIYSGTASGRLIGGNLTILTALIGSPYQPNFDHAILFVEDVNEKRLYELDRMFSQLKNAGILNKLSGFIFASCYGCNFTREGTATLVQILDTYIKPLQIPAFSGSMIGHLNSMYTIPIGVNAKIDANKYSITLLQSAIK